MEQFDDIMIMLYESFYIYIYIYIFCIGKGFCLVFLVRRFLQMTKGFYYITFFVVYRSDGVAKRKL